MTEPAARPTNAPQRTPEPDQRTTRHPAQKRNESGGFAELLRAALGVAPRPARGTSPQAKKSGGGEGESAHRPSSRETDAQPRALAEEREALDAGDERPRQRFVEHSEQASHRDPLERSLAQAYPVGFSAPHPTPEPPRNLLQLDPNLAEMIRRVAWGKQGARSTLRLELGGSLEGAVLLLGAEPNHGVSVSLELPANEDAAAWQARLRQRLEARGLSLETLEVR